MCSDHLSAAFMWRFLRASSLVARVSLQVGLKVARQDRYEVLDGPSENALCRGQLCVWIRCVTICYVCYGMLQGVSVKAAIGVVLSVMIRLTDFTPIFALQFECGKATDDRQWCTPHSFRNWRVAVAVNSGPPSVATSSGMPDMEVMNMPSWKSRLGVRSIGQSGHAVGGRVV